MSAVGKYHLSPDVVPENYNIVLRPDLEKQEFSGMVVIKVQIGASSDEQLNNSIVLHSKNLKITTLKLRRSEAEYVDTDFESADELLRILPNYSIKVGLYFIEIEFEGKLDGLVGFYSATKGSSKMAASKFQPTYARQAFPCFDEPQFKATFDIEIVHPIDSIALSNMNVRDTAPCDDGLKRTKFAPSVPMSTYLAVFVVCDFISRDVQIETGGIGKPFTLRNYAQRDQIDKISFALEISKRAVEYYIKYFQYEYPLPKLDQIAIPDYVSGATEHWGLVTYRETSFLIDQKTSSSLDRRNVANTIAHELAHMWFGNLVTMMWWDETWLNEGFATYMSFKCLAEIEPSWDFMSSFPVLILHSVFSLDATHSSHPIVMNVNTPDEITAIFDAISYYKASSVIRMLDHFIGERVFRNGISRYLEKYRYRNTTTQDLLDVLAVDFEAENSKSALSLRHIISTWTQQMGYPVLSVHFESGEPMSKLIITQKRFLADPDSTGSQPSTFNYRWFVPVTYKTNDCNNSDVVWFPDTAECLTLDMRNPQLAWVLLNRDQIGYYRVNYSNQLWLGLIELLRSKDNLEKIFTPSERAMLIDDSFCLADSGDTNFTIPLNLAKYLMIEREWAPWTAAITQFNRLRKRLQDTLGYGYLMSYIRNLLTPLYQSLSLIPDLTINENLQKNLLLSDILSFACSIGYEPALEEAITKFKSWLQLGNEIHPDLRSTVYVYGIQGTGEDEWRQLWSIYMNETDAQEKARLLKALTSTKDISLLKILLEYAWDESKVRAQDQITLIRQVAANLAGVQVVWDHVRERWINLVSKFTLNSRVLGGMIPFITSSFSCEMRLQELKSFFGLHPDAGAGAAAREQALENLVNNISWRLKHQDLIINWLKTN